MRCSISCACASHVHVHYFTSAAPLSTADDGYQPAMVIKSGDTVDVETVNGYTSRIASESVLGDPEFERILQWNGNGPNLIPRGAFGGGEGGHIITGALLSHTSTIRP